MVADARPVAIGPTPGPLWVTLGRAMTPDLPPPVADALGTLFDALPLDAAMPALTGEGDPPPDVVQRIERAIAHPALADRPALHAGLWLYVDQLDRSHTISQGIDDPTGSFWHGIMHRREADFSNSHYWFRNTGHHPAMDAIEGYDPHALIDAVEADAGRNDPKLVDLQRREWAALFAWCAARRVDR